MARRLAPALSVLGHAVVAVGSLVLGLASPAEADVVGMLDPELAEICGGSAHSPRCRTEHVGMACCGASVVALGALGGVIALRGRRERH